MTISADELGSITVDTWQTLLGLDPTPVQPPLPTDEVVWTSTVHITGDTQWTVRIDCSHTHALEAASAMFGTEPAETSEADITDSLGELANVVAGNVKALVDGGARLSLPTVARGSSFEVMLPGMVEQHRLTYTSEDAPVAVTLLQQAGKTPAPAVAPVAAVASA